MTAAFDASPWGTHPPSGYERTVLALTRAMPENWLGLRLAMVSMISEERRQAARERHALVGAAPRGGAATGETLR